MGFPETFPPEAADPQVRDLAGDLMPRLTGPSEIARRLAALDDAYIRAEYVPLADAVKGRPESVEQVCELIASRRLPQPAYRLDDGTDMVAADYFALLDAAGSIDALPAWFQSEYRTAATSLDLPADETDEAAGQIEWGYYLSGGYGVCLKQVTPLNIARKSAYIHEIEALLQATAPNDQQWCESLRQAVDGLHEIERSPRAVFDPPRWGGPTSEQWYGCYVRAAYPRAFPV